jgi:spermidine synthase
MLGIASGSFLITKRLGQIKRSPLLFLKTEMAIILFSVLFPFLLLMPAHHLENKIIYFLLYGVVLIMSFLSGTSIGLQFPLATKIYLSFYMGKRLLGETAGLLYAADLLGGFLGGLFGGILLLPILGIKQSCFLMGIIKASSLVLFLVFMKAAGNTKEP